MNLYKSIQSFQYNDNFKKWMWFVIETLVSAFVGALIAFVFGSNYWAALIAFSLLMFFLIVLSVFFIILESKVSVLSIMNQGLKDGKYEDVIKFGSAMRSTLFTANRNDEIVTLGYKIDEAASKIENDHYNKSMGDYQVTIDGKQQSITQIRIGLRIDDLGWSMHLCQRNGESVANIIDGIRRARNEAIRLSRIKGNQNSNLIVPFVKLILRGYRHLAGIYYEDAKEHWRGEFYEKVTKLIMSNHKIISRGDGLDKWIIKNPKESLETIYSMTYEKKVERARNNILDLYYKSNSKSNETVNVDATSINNYLNIEHGHLMHEVEIEDDVKLFNMLPIQTQNEIIKEQFYAWGRNIVKKIQNGIYKQGESEFISDLELSLMVSEARAFSQVYYYGPESIIVFEDFDNVINKDILGKSELRYLSLMNEIELVNLFQLSSRSMQSRERSDNLGRYLKIDKLIDNLKLTREILRDKRADLYVRTSLHLITALYYEYNLDFRYLKNDLLDKSIESRKKILIRCKDKIDNLYNEINNYEHKTNDDLEKRYQMIMRDFKVTAKRLNKKYVKTYEHTDDPIVKKFLDIDATKYSQHFKSNKLSSTTYKFSKYEIQKVKNKWGLQ